MEFLFLILCLSGFSTGILSQTTCHRPDITQAQIERRCKHPQSSNDRPVCNGRGVCEGCGICNCDQIDPHDPNNSDRYYGHYCECDREYCIEAACDHLTRQDILEKCKPSLRGEVCSGRGACRGCGECDCQPIDRRNPIQVWGGQYCECNDYDCEYSDGEICGGPDRGKCMCGECMCNPGFTGKACDDCPTSQETCMAKNGLVCAGRGMCKCGKCQCSLSTYTGPTCEECPGCEGGCKSTKSCVRCFVLKEGPLSFDRGCDDCGEVNFVDSIAGFSLSEWKSCSFKGGRGCVFKYAYNMLNHKQIAVEATADCPQPDGITAPPPTTTKKSGTTTKEPTTTSPTSTSQQPTTSAVKETKPKPKPKPSKTESGSPAASKSTCASPHWMTTLSALTFVFSAILHKL